VFPHVEGINLYVEFSNDFVLLIFKEWIDKGVTISRDVVTLSLLIGMFVTVFECC